MSDEQVLSSGYGGAYEAGWQSGREDGRKEERARIAAKVQRLLGEWITKYNRQVGVASAYDSAGVAYDDGRINALRQVLSIFEEDTPHE